MRAWPPVIEDVKTDANITTDVDDERLQMVLDACVAFVRRTRPQFNYDDDPTSCLPPPDDDLWLGTVRLAGRYHVRRRSVDGLVNMGELGAGRVPSFDPDIERLLRIGRFAKAVIG